MRYALGLNAVLLLFACGQRRPIEEQGTLSARQQAVSARCDSVLKSAAGHAFGAAVLIAMNDTVILSKGYGFIDSAHTMVPTDTTLFNLASITKSFTAVCIAQLESEGKLRRSDAIATYFPELPLDKRTITIEQCLTHTSGLGQNYAADGTRSVKEAVAAIGRDTLEGVPGAGFGYSNENYELLGAVVERVSGTSCEAYMREHILAPANLKHTKVWSEVNQLDPPLIASPMRPLDPSVFGVNYGYIGSGGLYGCTRDLYEWSKALRDGHLIPQAMLDTLWSPRLPISVGHMARGWFISTTNNAKEIWTRGNEDFGHNGVMRWFPEKGVLIIVLTNSGELGDKNTTGNRLLGDALVDVLIL